MALEETQASSHSSSHKRDREDDDVVEESAEAKRLRADLLLDIFEDDDRTGDGEPGADDDLATVMKSLEEEIGLASPAATDEPAEVESGSGFSSGSDEIPQPELGFLFEASDDELGLPPSLELGAAEEEAEAPSVGEGAAVFGQIWGYEDGIPSGYDAFDFGLEAGAAVDDSTAGAVSMPGEAEQDGVFFHGGLFDDYSDIWRPESLPAV